MPNIKSNKKHLRKSSKRAVANRSVLLRVRSQSKKIVKLINEKKLDGIESDLNMFYKYADKATKKGVLKKNSASRKKSEITKKISAVKQ